MTRPLVALVLLALPATASAQPGAPIPPGSLTVVGPAVVGGRVVIGAPITNGPSALYPVEVAVPPRFSVGGGSMSAPPQVWVPSGAWSVVRYPWPVVPVVVEPAPAAVPLPVAPPRAGAEQLGSAVQPVLSGEAGATLVVQFPGAAEVWVGGQKRDGTAAEWTLTSPTLRAGESHTFDVRGRWKADGKTFESSRSVKVSAGDRNRVIVVSGNEIRE